MNFNGNVFGALLCWMGLHRWNYSGNERTFAPAVIRCERCGRRHSKGWI